MSAYFPPVGFHFRVTFEIAGAGDRDFGFQEVSGIGMEMEVTSVVEGGENRFTQTLPTRANYPPLILKRGLLTDSAVIAWCRDAIENLDIKPVTIQVTLLNEEHTPLQAYNFVNAWPKKWSIDGFHAEESRLVIETMEIAYQYFRIL
jgi:phage tail-like protein